MGLACECPFPSLRYLFPFPFSILCSRFCICRSSLVPRGRSPSRAEFRLQCCAAKHGSPLQPRILTNTRSGDIPTLGISAFVTNSFVPIRQLSTFSPCLSHETAVASKNGAPPLFDVVHSSFAAQIGASQCFDVSLCPVFRPWTVVSPPTLRPRPRHNRTSMSAQSFRRLFVAAAH